MESSVSRQYLLEFELVFPNEKKMPFEYYLEGCSKEMILNSAVFFLSFKNQNSKYENKKSFLDLLFCKENRDFSNKIHDRFIEIEKLNEKIVIINTFSSLKLFEFYLIKSNYKATKTNKEFEICIFKAYLSINSDLAKNQNKELSNIPDSYLPIKVPLMMFCIQYPLLDKDFYDIKLIWATQMIKAIYLFQFLESNGKSKHLLDAFLAHFKSESWQEYLKDLIPLTMTAVEMRHEAHTDFVVTKNENYERGCAFIEKLIVEEIDPFDHNDFLSIRAKPFYKIKEGVYRVIFNLFLVEKIFKGVYFLLRDVNNTLPTSIKVKNIKSFYGDEFSEKILCYKVLENLYKEKCVRFSGKEFAEMKIDGAPDYYIRKGKSILLFESKDFLISADKKMSFNFNIYEQEFKRVLHSKVLNGNKIKPKAIIQLIGCIKKVLKKEFFNDVKYNYKDVVIYPILLTHDLQYDTPGFNELLDFWFQEELIKLKNEGFFVHRVKPLTVVNIDSLIFHQVGLSKNILLHEMLNLYIENKKNKTINSQNINLQNFDKYVQNQMTRHIPFSLYIDRYFKEKGFWISPPLLELAIPAIFNEEYKPKLSNIY